MLLCHRKTITSFENLRTLNGQIYPTFTQVCIELGLLADDHEWSRAMQEGTVWMLPRALRRLFVCILLYCHPLHPNNLWSKFKESMSEDFSRHCPPQMAEKKALKEINKILIEEGKNIHDYLQILEIDDIYENEEQNEPVELENLLKKGVEQYQKLNEEQKIIVDKIIQSVEAAEDTRKSSCYFIDGPGGSGKTYTYNTLWHLLTGKGKNVKTMAYTGIAATLLPNGKTAHKTIGLSVPIYREDTSTISLNSKKHKN